MTKESELHPFLFIPYKSPVKLLVRILWISHFVPFPPTGGAFQRSYNLIKELSRANEVHLIAVKHKAQTHRADDDNNLQAELEKICHRADLFDLSYRTQPSKILFYIFKSLLTRHSFTWHLLKSEKLKQLIHRKLQVIDFDLVYVDSISLAWALDAKVGVKKILGHQNVESLMIRRRIRVERNIFKKALYYIESKKLETEEKENCPRYDLNLVVSVLDKGTLESINKNISVEIVENGVDTEYFKSVYQSSNRERNIVFAGRLSQYSNNRGLIWFYANVWRALRTEQHDVNLYILGANPSKKLRNLVRDDPSVHLLGFVDDIRRYYERSMGCVCPILDGGGTRLKVLDAMALGMPVVSTSICAEGLAVVDKHDIVICDDVQEYKNAIVNLLDDERFRDHLSKNARTTIENKYSWDIVGRKFRETCKALEL